MGQMLQLSHGARQILDEMRSSLLVSSKRVEASRAFNETAWQKLMEARAYGTGTVVFEKVAPVFVCEMPIVVVHEDRSVCKRKNCPCKSPAWMELALALHGSA